MYDVRLVLRPWVDDSQSIVLAERHLLYLPALALYHGGSELTFIVFVTLHAPTNTTTTTPGPRHG